jgi:hypothetical protein
MNYSHMTLPLSIRKEKRAYTKSSKEQLLVSIMDYGRWVKAKELIKVTKLSSVDPPTFQFGVHYPVTPPTPKQAEQPTALVEAKEEARFWKEKFVELSFKLAERS